MKYRKPRKYLSGTQIALKRPEESSSDITTDSEDDGKDLSDLEREDNKEQLTVEPEQSK